MQESKHYGHKELSIISSDGAVRSVRRELKKYKNSEFEKKELY